MKRDIDTTEKCIWLSPLNGRRRRERHPQTYGCRGDSAAELEDKYVFAAEQRMNEVIEDSHHVPAGRQQG